MIRYTSRLQPEFGEELERLMFFNRGQRTAFDGIVDSIEKFGVPTVQVEGGRLQIEVEKLDEVQTLFALADDRLIGVMVYSRVTPECLTVIHLAVDPEYSSQGRFAGSMMALRMLDQLRRGACRIKGVETIRVLYGGKRARDLRVKS